LSVLGNVNRYETTKIEDVNRFVSTL